jgi:hypothetical protein
VRTLAIAVVIEFGVAAGGGYEITAGKACS